MHGDERGDNVHAKRFSCAQNYHANKSLKTPLISTLMLFKVVSYLSV